MKIAYVRTPNGPWYNICRNSKYETSITRLDGPNNDQDDSNKGLEVIALCEFLYLHLTLGWSHNSIRKRVDGSTLPKKTCMFEIRGYI